jgi:hypothetical protein
MWLLGVGLTTSHQKKNSLLQNVMQGLGLLKFFGMTFA